MRFGRYTSLQIYGKCVGFHSCLLRYLLFRKFGNPTFVKIYGFKVGGKIYIDPRIADTETPIHEYTHLLATALRANKAEEWPNVVNLMKGEKELWDEIRKRYPELKTDYEIADEVLAQYSGKRGAECLREEQCKIAQGEGSVFEKAQAVSALERICFSAKRMEQDGV